MTGSNGMSVYMIYDDWLCFTSHRQRGHLETVPPFTVPCEGREARFLHCSHQESNPGPSCGSPLHYSCATLAPLCVCMIMFIVGCTLCHSSHARLNISHLK